VRDRVTQRALCVASATLEPAAGNEDEDVHGRDDPPCATCALSIGQQRA
jgi:hypothetical protein